MNKLYLLEAVEEVGNKPNLPLLWCKDAQEAKDSIKGFQEVLPDRTLRVRSLTPPDGVTDFENFWAWLELNAVVCSEEWA
jgi:hypothetical protein